MRAGVTPADQAAGVAHSCRRIDQQKCVDAAAAEAACGGHLPHFAARAIRWVHFVSMLNHYYLSTQVSWDVTLGGCFLFSVFFSVTYARNAVSSSPRRPLGHRQNPNGQNPQENHGKGTGKDHPRTGQEGPEGE